MGPHAYARLGTDPASLSFHVARDPEFLEGVHNGRQLLPQEWNLRANDGWWNAAFLIQLVCKELNPETQASENQFRQCLNVPPHTPVYHLGLAAGLLACFAEAATSGEVRSC